MKRPNVLKNGREFLNIRKLSSKKLFTIRDMLQQIKTLKHVTQPVMLRHLFWFFNMIVECVSAQCKIQCNVADNIS